MLTQLGVKDVQVEELYSLDEETFEDLRPVYALIFLFKWRSEERDERPIADAPHVFFANQVVNNACATQAILSAILNCPELDIGNELRRFKTFTVDFPPEVKGLAITNSDIIRNAHNSFARPEGIVIEGRQATEKDDVFHFITYMPIYGHAFELDGLKRGPIDLGSCEHQDWLSIVRPVIQNRMEAYARSEIRFNLMAIVRSPRSVLLKAIAEMEAKKAALVSQIQPVAHTVGGNDPVPMDVDHPNTMEAIDLELARLRGKLAAEEEKLRSWAAENVRRKHNYIPFIANLLKVLAERGHLEGLIKKAMENEHDRP